MIDTLKREAAILVDAGASMLDFTSSGPVAGPEVVRAIDIPVIGGLGGGPWLDGRVRSVAAAIGYLAAAVDDPADRYANVAGAALIAIKAFSEDVRAGRQIRGAEPGARKS
jgi:3-methyl-2-oxobutanoate hydroxymethyltransferase